MLISKTIWWVLLILSGLAGFFGIACLKATSWSVMSPREKRITGALLSGLALCAMFYFMHRDVITCSEEGGSVHAERQVEILTSHDGTLIVNRTSQTLQIVTVWYGMGGYGDPTPVPPGKSVSWDDEVDNIGPSNPPPSQIRSETSIDSRCWLTW